MSAVSPESAERAIEQLKQARSRRRFLAGAGALAAAAAGAGSASTAFGSSVITPMLKGSHVQDTDILNFALNLEYLEAEFYLQAAFGRGLSAGDRTGTGTQGTVSGGRQVSFAVTAIQQYAREIAADEEAHVKLLRSAIGRKTVAEPTINIGTAFTTAARAAGVIASNATFDPYASDDNFLLAAFIFEDVGVTAYRGAAPLVDNPVNLSAAAGLLGTEAYHAGIIRTVLFSRGQQNAALITNAGKISDLRDTADGAGDDDQGITGTGGVANIVPTDANGLVFARSIAQVLNIVYLGGASASFGFFPNRLNGRLA